MKLPAAKPAAVVKALKKIGFILIRQKGSHQVFSNKTTKRIVVVPIHRRELKKGTLKSIIKQSGINREAFLRLLK